MAVNDYLSAVHSVATAVLSIASNYNCGSIHERSQVVPRLSEELNLNLLVQISTYIPLSVNIMELDSVHALGDRIPQFDIELLMGKAISIYLHNLGRCSAVILFCHLSYLPFSLPVFPARYR